MAVSIHQLLKAMVDQNASDLHVTTGTPPQLRIDGKLVPLKIPALQPAETKQLCYAILTEAQKKKFEDENELDLSFGVKGLARFRGNIFVQRGAMAGAFRLIPHHFLSLEELGLPHSVIDLTKRPNGLILITGPTGSGKTTTLASVIDRINSERNEHIITIEDPIEYIHHHKKCLVNQREVGSDTASFKKALRYILRQDPDVVLLGELRDLETIEAALTIAETGHLCFATLHTNSCVQSINRIIDVFPVAQQTQVRTQLSFVLEGVLSQALLPLAQGSGRVLALELMIPNTAIRALIRDDKVHQIYSQMQMGQDKFGMQTMNQCLYQLFSKNKIAMDVALQRSSDPEEFKQMVQNPGQFARRQVPTSMGKQSLSF